MRLLPPIRLDLLMRLYTDGVAGEIGAKLLLMITRTAYEILTKGFQNSRGSWGILDAHWLPGTI
jgi:hypothetical protein